MTDDRLEGAGPATALTATALARGAATLTKIAGSAGAGDELDGLLAEVRALLAADTAVLLVLDSSSSMLVPVAWSGMGARGRASMRLRVGQGFAGRVASTRSPVVLDEVTAANVVNPLLLRRGIASLLGVPVLRGHVGGGGSAESALVGVVHVGSLTPRAFTGEEIKLLQGAAERLAAAVQDRRSAEEHTAALVLQRSLLPSVLPHVAGLEFAARYIPADGDFGGDWYDVFDLPDGRVGVVMGDVVGHGLAASVVMGRLRSALRAYALVYDDPAAVLSKLDRHIVHFEPGSFATVIYGVSATPFDTFSFSCAGHPAPLLAELNVPARQLRMRADPPLGAAPGCRRRTQQVNLVPGTSLCLFTDGLVERRPTDHDSDTYAAGIQRAAAVFTAADPEAVCTTVLERVLHDDSAEDDVALLVLRRHAS